MATGSWLSQPGRLRALLADARLAVRLLRDPAVPAVTKLILGAAGFYLIWPIDLLPDLVPIIGQLDDLGVALAALQMFLHLCPEAPVAFHRAAVAARRPYSRMPTERDGFIDAEFRGD